MATCIISLFVNGNIFGQQDITDKTVLRSYKDLYLELIDTYLTYIREVALPQAANPILPKKEKLQMELWMGKLFEAIKEMQVVLEPITEDGIVFSEQQNAMNKAREKASKYFNLLYNFEPKAMKEERQAIQKEKALLYAQNKDKLLRDMIDAVPGIESGVWTAEKSLWLKVPAHFANDKPTCKEIAETAASFFRTKLGHGVCVHVYYGKFHEITSACE